MPEWLRRFVHPREGWLALGLLLVMVLSLTWSVQRVEWLRQTDFLVVVGCYGVIAGAILGLTRLSVVVTLPVSALLGAFIVAWSVGGEYFPELTQIGRLLALRDEAFTFTRIVVDRGFAPQLTPYALGIGVLMWVTGFIAAYTLYRHHRILDAILVVGALLIANMSSTFTNLFGYLILFMLAALLLWLRAALTSREEGWQRRRVNENVDVPAAIMRSGIVFIAGSIALAWVLTTVAVAAPLTRVWNNLDTVWTSVRDQLDSVFGGLANPDARFTGTTFGPSVEIRGEWRSDDAPVLQLTAQRGYYLFTRTYDTYTGHGWIHSGGSSRQVDAGIAIFPDYTPERPVVEESFTTETVSILIERSTGRNLFSPGYPTTAFVPIVVQETGGQPLIAALESASSIEEGRGYSITAKVSRATKAQLRVAGTDYPPAVEAYYLGTEGVTARTAERAREIVQAAGAETPFDQAEAIARYLQRDGPFEYRTSVTVPDDPNADIVDFFLFDPNGQAGYCEHFASAMVVMARTLGLPARYTVGFAPGESIGDNTYQVRERNAHAWAEIYFPGYGWQIFEATKSIRPVPRLSGVPVAPGSLPVLPVNIDDYELGIVTPGASFAPFPDAIKPGDDPLAPPTNVSGGNALIFAAAILVVLGLVAWRLRRARRGWRFLAPGDRQWHRLALAGDRAGVGQRPSETIYEYAGWLEEQIPRRRPEIRTIATGKVLQSYSGRSITSDAIARIEAAWSRLELPLLWLAVKRRVGGFFKRR